MSVIARSSGQDSAIKVARPSPLVLLLSRLAACLEVITAETLLNSLADGCPDGLLDRFAVAKHHLEASNQCAAVMENYKNFYNYLYRLSLNHFGVYHRPLA